MLWNNGTEVTAADFAFGWQVFYDPASGFNCQPYCPITSVSTPDRYTVIYHLSGLDHPFLLRDIPQASPVVWPGAWGKGDVHAAVAKMNESSFSPANGSFPNDGPYEVAREVGTNRIDFRPMKYYDIMSCGLYVKNITYLYYDTPAKLLAAVATGKVDLSDSWPSTSLSDLERSRGRYRVHVDPSPVMDAVVFNVDAVYGGKPNPVHDVRVRQALNLALDKRALIANGFDLNSRQTSNVIQWSFCVNSPKVAAPCADRSIAGQWDPIAHRYDPNPGKGVALLDAKKLLSQTRWSRGFTLDYLGRSDALQRRTDEASIAASWARLGVRLKVSYVDSGTMFETYDNAGMLARGRFQVSQYSPGPGLGLHPELLTNDFTSAYDSRDPRNASKRSSSLALNFSGIHDPVIDHAFAILAGTLDDSARSRAWDAAEEELAKQGYWNFLYAREYVYTEDERIANLSDSVDRPGLASPFEFWNLWDWKVK
jgi:ABC-type transport system substrate-binding protein